MRPRFRVSCNCGLFRIFRDCPCGTELDSPFNFPQFAEDLYLTLCHIPKFCYLICSRIIIHFLAPQITINAYKLHANYIRQNEISQEKRLQICSLLTFHNLYFEYGKRFIDTIGFIALVYAR